MTSEPFRTLTPDELYAMLRMSDDPTQTLVGLIRGIDYPAKLSLYIKEAARKAAREAARKAAREAAWAAARDAAREAAREAARKAAREAAWDAAREAAWDAAWEAAWDAAWKAAREAAWDAAREAAWDAAWKAAREAALLAGCMVVSDLIERKHLNFALEQMCWWIKPGEDITCPR